MMERSPRCELCSSSNANLLICDHIQHFNEQNTQCEFSSIIHLMGNVGINIFGNSRLCDDCGETFNSNIEYEEHKRKVSCTLETYGCLQQTDLCSINQHYNDHAHVEALKKAVINLKAPYPVDLIRKLTECLGRNSNHTNETINDAIYFDDGSVLALNDFSTGIGIDNADRNQLTNEQKEDLFQDLLIRGEQNENIITFKINQLDSQENNQQTIDHLTTVNELTEQINKLKAEVEQTTEINQFLNIDRGLRELKLSNVSVSNNGLLIWIIENISKKIDYSYSHPTSYINSPTFSSLTGEHPLNAQLFLHGIKNGYPNYISIYVTLGIGGKNNLSAPLTCCLVDQTNNHQHFFKHASVELNQYNVGNFCQFVQFIQAIEVHEAASRFVKNDSLCIIVKLHEDQSNEYKNYEISIQDAVQQINSLTFS